MSKIKRTIFDFGFKKKQKTTGRLLTVTEVLIMKSKHYALYYYNKVYANIAMPMTQLKF